LGRFGAKDCHSDLAAWSHTHTHTHTPSRRCTNQQRNIKSSPSPKKNNIVVPFNILDVYVNAESLRPLQPSSSFITGKKSHLRKTSEKKPPTKESIARLQQSAIWKMENEFYEFALEQFQFVRAHAVREKDGELYLLAQNFFYEKIYPKN